LYIRKLIIFFANKRRKRNYTACLVVYGTASSALLDTVCENAWLFLTVVVYVYTGWSKKDTQFYFWDNFNNSALILPFFHRYKQKFMAHKCEVLAPTTPLSCDHIT